MDGTVWEIRYDQWDTGEFPDNVYHISNTNVVTLNQSSGFFTGAYKDVFKRFFLAIALADINSNSKRQFLTKLSEGLADQFTRTKP